MNRLAYIKVSCIAAVMLFALVEIFINVIPYAEALGPRSFDSPVKIDENTFPDVAFREYVSENIDEDEDGYLTPQECDAVKTIGASEEGTWAVTEDGLKGKGVSDITGVDLFVNLESINLSYNSLSVVDMTRNKKLKQLDLRGNFYEAGEKFQMHLPETEGVVYVIVSTNTDVDGESLSGEVVLAD